MALAGGLNGGRVLDVHGEGEVRVHDLHKRTVWRLSLSGEQNVLMDMDMYINALGYTLSLNLSTLILITTGLYITESDTNNIL